MRILWQSNYTSFSSYSNQARLFVPRLVASGHHVDVLALANGSNMAQMVDGVKLLPTWLDPRGNDSVRAHFERTQAHITISLIDAFGLFPEVMEHVNWCPITPIDHAPVPDMVMKSLDAAFKVIAMSRFAEAQLKQRGIDSLYMPLAYDPAVWVPGDMNRARQQLGWAQNRFVVAFVGVNDSNPARKGIPEMLAAWQMFSREYPDALLYLHTAETGNMPVAGATGGVDIPKLITMLGINPDSIQIVDQGYYRTGLPAAHLVNVARAADVLLLPSRGEGFGLPLLEFAAVGCPSITSDFAAGAELCPNGWLIDGEMEWSWQSAWRLKPGIASMYEAIGQAYQERGNQQRRRDCMVFAQEFAIDRVVAEYTLPALNTIAEMLLEAV